MRKTLKEFWSLKKICYRGKFNDKKYFSVILLEYGKRRKFKQQKQKEIETKAS